MNKKLRVLIVEDSESDTALEIRALEQAGYKTLYKRVEDAKQMEAALREQTWDVVLVDHCLPQMGSERVGGVGEGYRLSGYLDEFKDISSITTERQQNARNTPAKRQEYTEIV